MVARKSKYHNEKVEYKGKTFDSKKEFEYYLFLESLEKSGVIKELRTQVPIEIQPSFIRPDGSKERAITYLADFTYTDDQGYHVVDAKGMKTEVYKLKKKLLAYRGIYIEEV